MTDRIPMVSPWNDLAGRALRHAIAGRWDIALRCVNRLGTTYGPDVIPQVMLAWIDSAIGVIWPDGPPPAEKVGGLTFWHEGDTHTETVDQVPPGIRWAGRFWMARIIDDEAQGRALIAAVQGDEEWRGCVSGVLDVSASAIRLARAGGELIKWGAS